MKTSIIIIGVLLVTLLAADLPKIDFKDLLDDPTDVNRIKDNGGKVGAFVLTNLGTPYETALKNFITKLPNCFDNQQLPSLEMDDGSLRTTFATINFEPLDCLKYDMNVIMDTFKKVDKAVFQMIKSQANFPPIETLSKIHAHLYQQQIGNTNGSKAMVPYHTDNGLYLLITPYPGQGLTLKTSLDTEMDTNELGLDSLVVLMGRGLTDWLLPDDFRNQFHAVPHAVKALDQPLRSIMAMMKIAPDQTLVNGIPFQAMFENNVGLCTDSK